jgi:phage terminase large subunit
VAEVVIDYKPRNWSLALHEATTRWIIMVLHRRAGKTTAVLNHLQRDCLRTVEAQFAYIAPTYKQAKRVAWDIAKKISRDIPGVEYNESELTVRYPNGSKLFLAGSDNPDSLRGIALWGVGFDEYPQQPSNIFTEIISKALADHLGYAIFFGTPKGKNEFHRIYSHALTDPAWTVIFKTIDDSLRDETGETIDNLRQALEDDRKLVETGIMTEDEFNQEWYCSFEASVKGSYYGPQIAKARADGRIKLVPYDPQLKAHAVWDLGVGQNLAIGIYQRVGAETHKIDYWQGSNKDGIPEAITALKAKPYVFAKMFVPHDAEGTESGTGKTRLATAKSLWSNVEWVVVPKLSVDDGIAKGRAMFARLWIDERNCGQWLDAISQYRQEWDDNRGMFLEKPYHDWTSHGADEYRYAAIAEDQMTNAMPMPAPTTNLVKPFYPGMGV